MISEQINASPILSICVPTFNRASSLRNLLRSLAEVKLRFGSAVEICISNNGSTDDTAAVIAEFQPGLGLCVISQSCNIGGTLNMIAVAQITTGCWGVLVGDDDELVPDTIGELLDYLKKVDSNNWVLVEAEDPEGNQYLGKFREGRYTNSHFRSLLLRTGLDPFGFMGVHVFPKSAVLTLGNLDLEDAQPWPHIAALLRKIIDSEGSVCVLKKPAILQAKGGAKLFWTGGDLARIRLAKIRILMNAYKDNRRKFWFYHLMMLRELYSPKSISSLLAWKLYEPEDFNNNAVTTYLRGYSWLGSWMLLALPHAFVMFQLRLLPNSLYAACFRLIGKGYLFSRYQALKSELGLYDGIKRGI
jgi:glycosyltransferase involved in cell wall biosynthesis